MIVRGVKNAALAVLIVGAEAISGNAMAAEQPKETTAQCIAEITAEYDTKIADAKSAGKDKAVDVYTKRRAEFLENCKLNDQIINGEETDCCE